MCSFVILYLLPDWIYYKCEWWKSSCSRWYRGSQQKSWSRLSNYAWGTGSIMVAEFSRRWKYNGKQLVEMLAYSFELHFALRRGKEYRRLLRTSSQIALNYDDQGKKYSNLIIIQYVSKTNSSVLKERKTRPKDSRACENTDSTRCIVRCSMHEALVHCLIVTWFKHIRFHEQLSEQLAWNLSGNCGQMQYF